MSFAVQSYPELYTTLLGWSLYDQIWTLLTQTGLAYLPFIGIVLRNMTQPYVSQETKDAGSTSLRRMEVDLIGTLLLIFFAVSPAFLLDPALISYTPVCASNGNGSGNGNTVHPGNTGTSYDKAFTVPTGEIRVPIWWYAVMAISQGITSGANTMVACVPNLRSMVTEVQMTKITDPELKQEIQEFEQDCFIPARTQYLSDTHTNSDALPTINSAISEYGADDTEWVGSHAFSQTYYQNHKASQPVKGFTYDSSQDINADTNTNNPPPYGTPSCNQWWNDPQHGLKVRLSNVLPKDFWNSYDSVLADEKTHDDLLKSMIFNSHDSGYDKANNMVGDVGYSHLAAGLGAWLGQLDAYPKLYAAAEAAPIIQSLLLLMVYAFLPLALVFTGYKPAAFISGAVIIFSLIFWSFIWHLVSWTDTALMNALYGSNWFSHQSPNATLVDMITGTLIIVAPLFWFSFMGSMGIKVGDVATVAMNKLGAIGDETSSKGAGIIKNEASNLLKKE